MNFYDATSVRNALSFGRLVPALEHAFCQQYEIPQRMVLKLSDAPVTSLVMPAWQKNPSDDGRRYYGVKVINIAPGNATLGLSALHANYNLFDADTGQPLAIMDGGELTARRTAASSALAAAKILQSKEAQWVGQTQKRPKTLLIVGTGRIASLLPTAYLSVIDIETILFWGRDFANAQRLADQLQNELSAGLQRRQLGIGSQLASIKTVAMQNLEEAMGQADIVSCATLATEPVIRGAWLKPQSHLDLIGSFTPLMREADDACFAQATLYVDSLEALTKSGDLIGPLQRGVFEAANIAGTLEGLCRLRPSQNFKLGRSVFKSVGLALEDLAAAILVFQSGSPRPSTTGF